MSEQERPNNNHVHSQGNQIHGEVMLSTDEIVALLAHDFERYAKISKDVLASPIYSFSYDEVTSPSLILRELKK